MPLYDYRCPECGLVIDVLHARDYTEAETCKICMVPMNKLLGTGMRFRYEPGSFFEPYETSDITGEPVVVKSREHMHKLARDNNLTVRKGPAKLR